MSLIVNDSKLCVAKEPRYTHLQIVHTSYLTYYLSLLTIQGVPQYVRATLILKTDEFEDDFSLAKVSKKARYI